MDLNDNDSMFMTEYLRKIKASGLMSPETVSVYRGKCPECKQIIEFSEALTHGMILPSGRTVGPFDEAGVMLGCCAQCASNLAIPVQNPKESCIRYGAEKVGYALGPVDDYVASLPVVVERFNVEEKIGRRDYGYDFVAKSLYVCDVCGRDLDAGALTALRAKLPDVSKWYGDFVNWWLAHTGGRGWTLENVIVRIEFACECQHKLVAFFYAPFSEAAHLDTDCISLANIIGSRPLWNHRKLGIYSKSEAMDLLKKLLARWMLAFDEVYLISPFFGHKYLGKDERLEIWLDLLKRIEPRKTHIITKTQELNQFRKAFAEATGNQYDMLVELGLGSPAIEEAQRKNNFHAKIYCAATREHCEVFEGSANVVEGPSKENMSFHQIDSEKSLRNVLLNPLEVKATSTAETEKRYSMLFDQRQGFRWQWNGGQANESEYFELVINDPPDWGKSSDNM